MDRKAHWEQVYASKRPDEVSWFQPTPTRSLALIEELGLPRSTRVIDVGGGDSTLVDALLERGFDRVTVLDLSGAALARAQLRLGERAAFATWIEGDVTRVQLEEGAFDLWHDRAVFHFLTDAGDRARYAALAARALAPGGTAIIATFAPDGPQRCSGLDVARYDAEGIAAALGEEFTLVRGLRDVHRTPSGKEQRFTFAVLRRR